MRFSGPWVWKHLNDNKSQKEKKASFVKKMLKFVVKMLKTIQLQLETVQCSIRGGSLTPRTEKNSKTDNFQKARKKN